MATSACLLWLLCLSVSSYWAPAKRQRWTDVPGGELDKSALVAGNRTGWVLLNHLFILSIYREIKAPKVKSSLEESRTESLPGRSPQSMVKEPSVHPERGEKSSIHGRRALGLVIVSQYCRTKKWTMAQVTGTSDLLGPQGAVPTTRGSWAGSQGPPTYLIPKRDRGRGRSGGCGYPNEQILRHSWSITENLANRVNTALKGFSTGNIRLVTRDKSFLLNKAAKHSNVLLYTILRICFRTSASRVNVAVSVTMESSYVVVNFVSAWLHLGAQMCGQTFLWMCLWGCIRMGFTFKSVDFE